MHHYYGDRGCQVRAFIADTTAMLLFFTMIGSMNERFIAGMSWEEVLHARLLGAAMMILVARLYGRWRDWVMRRAQPNRLSHTFWDSVAHVSFQVPLYGALIAVSGASGSGLWLGILGATLILLVSGRPYGIFLNRIRKLYGLPSG